MLSPYNVMKPRQLLIAITVCSTVISLTVFRKQISSQLRNFTKSISIKVEMPAKTMRQNLTFFTNVSTGVMPPGANASTAEAIFHRYASELQVVCPEAKRIGKQVDGGWDVCIFSSYKPRPNCLIYSFGINNDWSFDDEAVLKYNCTLRAFDPSMAASDHRRGQHIWFYKQGISGSDFKHSNGWQLRTFESFLKMFNESDEIIDYLKIDVEYSEWSALETILNSTVLSKVKQFGLETHTKDMNKKPSSIEDLVYYTQLLLRLHDAGFYRWYWHYNHYGVFVSSHSQLKLTCCYEMVFINVDIPRV